MSEWIEVRLGDICDIYDGPHATPPKLDSGFIFLGISSLGFDGRIDSSHFEFISEDSFKKWTKRIEPRYQDIVFSYETKLGVAAIIPKNLKCCLGRRMGLLRPKEGVDPRFLLYAYLAPEFQKTIYERTFHGSTVDRIPLKDMPNFPISIPRLEVQKAITAVLSSLDDKIDLLHRQNKTLEALAQTLFRHWFIDGADDDWEEKSLVDFIDFKEGPGIRNWQYVEDEDGINFINIRLIQNGEIDLQSANKISREEAFGKYAHFLLREKDMIVSTSGTLGRSAIVRSYHLPLCLNTSVIRFRPVDEVHYSFMYQYLQSEEFLSQLTSMASGSVQLNFGPTHLKRITMVIPPKNTLDEFEILVSPLYQRTNTNYLQIQTLEKLRDTLLPKLMSGEVRVRQATELTNLKDLSIL